MTKQIQKHCRSNLSLTGCFSPCGLKHCHKDLLKCCLNSNWGSYFNYTLGRKKITLYLMILSSISPLPKHAGSNFTPLTLRVHMLYHCSANRCDSPTFSALQDVKGVFIHLLWLSKQPDGQPAFLKTAFVFRTPSTCHSPIHKLRENVMLGLGWDALSGSRAHKRALACAHTHSHTQTHFIWRALWVSSHDTIS